MSEQILSQTAASTEVLNGQQVWRRLHKPKPEVLDSLGKALGVDLTPRHGRAVICKNDFVIIPIELVVRQGSHYVETMFMIYLGKDTLITVEQDVTLQALNVLEEESKEHATWYTQPKQVFLRLLELLNEETRDAIINIAKRLDERSDEVVLASGGFETSGPQAGVADISGTAIALGEAEELFAKTVEGQLMLARAARWLRRFTHLDSELKEYIAMLLADIQSLRRYAEFQHVKIRNLQQSLMTTLDLKQNQVIKVFTVVTAVFTPPTLIAAFYGQNFAHMPELEIPWGEWAMMALTAIFALLPMLYVKRKGWMR
ncbi:hypothetical protein AAEX37_00514 [Oligella sp. MSHR50489EDL]|uniref:CorA family divalent cation transporter n=1 Tax=Oligella sp. MSHR50489EDL TaxID=3139409 RepID=UPI003D8148EC